MIYLFIFIFGLIIGSFINCLIWRLHKGESIMGRSYCPKCKKQIVWYDNVPVLSFIILGGRCRNCGKAISWQYPAAELVTAALFVIAFSVNLSHLPSNIFSNFQSFGFAQDKFLISNIFLILNSKFLILLLRDWFLISVMMIIFIYDLRWYLILDIIVLPACVIVFIFNLLLGFSWMNLLISGIIGASFFLIQFIISKGRWIGSGDIRLGLLMGLALGWPKIIVAIFLAYWIGAVISVGLIISRKKQWSSQIPLGIFLTAATIITIFFGADIITWYIRLVA